MSFRNTLSNSPAGNLRSRSPSLSQASGRSPSAFEPCPLGLREGFSKTYSSPFIKTIIFYPFFLLLFLCPLFAFSSHPPSYPPEWWKPFPKEEAPSWEILPQEATYGVDVILSKRTELGLFSNFANTPFELDGKRYASIEGFWQMMKYPDPDDPDDPRRRTDLVWKYRRGEVAELSGFDAKYAGDATKENTEKLGIKWISYRGKRIDYKGKDQEEHYKLIFRATEAKIDQNPKAKALLEKTGRLILRPDHQQPSDATAAYRYHEILMKIRE